MTLGPDRGKPVEPAAPERHRASSAALLLDRRAGRGRFVRDLPIIEELLRSRSIRSRVFLADGASDLVAMTRRAIDEGATFLVAVGDVATTNGVLNGMMEDDRPRNDDLVLGILAANSGNDIVRTFGLTQDPATAIERIHDGLVYAVDVGKASAVEDRTGLETTRYFLNMAQAGLGGAAIRRTARLPGGLGRAGSFLGFWLALAAFRRPRIKLDGDRRNFEGSATNVMVANLQFGGHGLRLSPRSWPEDGYFDLQVFTGPKSDSFTLLPKMFRGEHLPHPNILEYRSTRVRIEADRPVFVEVDGVPLGTTPATFQVVPRALRLKV